jgi:DNA modification methylase
MCDRLAPRKKQGDPKMPEMKGNPKGADDGGKGLLIDGYRRQSKKLNNGKDPARRNGQDLMRGEHKVGDSKNGRPFGDTFSIPKGEYDYPVDALQSSGTSIFDPVLCELTYRWFCPSGGTIIDPFAGGSVRGIVASKVGLQYVGIELRAEQVEANRGQSESICSEDPTPPVWHTGDSRNIATIAKDVKADLVFSCPPYADLEVYSDDPKDLSTLDYAEFVEAYREIIAAAVSLLKPNRFAVFVVGDIRDKKGFYRGFVSDTISAFEDAGAILYNEAILVTSVGSLPIRTSKQFQSGRKLGKTHQNYLCFYKGDPKQIRADFGDVEIDESLFASDDAQFGEVL